MKKKVALIIGITGQDGSYLAEYLIKKNYVVHGMVRRSSMPNTQRIDHILTTSRVEEKSKKKFYENTEISVVQHKSRTL